LVGIGPWLVFALNNGSGRSGSRCFLHGAYYQAAFIITGLIFLGLAVAALVQVTRQLPRTDYFQNLPEMAMSQLQSEWATMALCHVAICLVTFQFSFCCQD